METHGSREAKVIRQRMEELRRDLDEDVQAIAVVALGMREWRTYVRSFPWVCLGTAFTVGYLIVPRHRWIKPDVEMLAELANQSQLIANSNITPKGQMRRMLLTFVGSLMMRGISSIVGRYADRLLANPAASLQQDGHP